MLLKIKGQCVKSPSGANFFITTVCSLYEKFYWNRVNEYEYSLLTVAVRVMYFFLYETMPKT